MMYKNWLHPVVSPYEIAEILHGYWRCNNGDLPVWFWILYQVLQASLLYKHTSEIRGLRSTKCFSKMLQNLLYFMYKKTHVIFFIFISCNFIFLPYKCPGLCRHRPGHSLGKNIKLHEMKNKKKLHGFSYT